MLIIKEVKTAYYLLEGMLDGGLSFVGSHLNNRIGNVIIITDAVGKIYYPDFSDKLYILPQPLDQTNPSLNVIPNKNSQNVYYHPGNQCLYYTIQHNTSSIAYIIVENITLENAAPIIPVLAQSELAIKYDFTHRNKNKEDFGQSLWENFLSTNASVPDKLRLYEQNMDNKCYYFVSILELEEGASTVDWNRLRTYLYEVMQRDRLEYLSSIIVPGRLITIIRAIPTDSPMDIDPDWNGREYLLTSKESIEEKFNITISFGFGRAYLPSGLLKSYQEACIVLGLSHIMGKKQFVQYFSQLGVFTALFSNDTETLKNYCLQILGKVIQHDQKHRTDYLGTMRMLLDNDCSWTTTANQLYVHVNTVYYRMVKVEKLLNLDFSQFETRLHLYTAIKVWDTLQVCKLLD